MKQTLLLILLVMGQLSFGQNKNALKVPGTKCSIIPPAGFVAATTFSGFQDSKTGSSVMINEIPTSYQSISDGFTKEALKSKGMTMISKEIIDYAGSKATFINVSQPANGVTYFKQMLIFGDGQGSVLVNGIYPEASKSIEGAIKTSLLSTVYSAGQSENIADAAAFSIETGGTSFKLVKYLSGSLIYSTDDNIPTNKPTIIVANSLSKIQTQNRKAHSEERLKKLPRGDSSSIKSINEITIDNLKGYEIVAEGKNKDNKPQLLYQVMLYNDLGDYYMIFGQASDEFETNLNSYKKLAKTFRRK